MSAREPQRCLPLPYKAWPSIDPMTAVPCMQRERYDSTGRVEKSVEEEFSDSFAGGKHTTVPASLATASACTAPCIRLICTGFCNNRGCKGHCMYEIAVLFKPVARGWQAASATGPWTRR